MDEEEMEGEAGICGSIGLRGRRRSARSGRGIARFLRSWLGLRTLSRG